MFKMSPYRQASTILLVSSLFFIITSCQDARSCRSEKKAVHGGEISIKGSMQYRVKCDDGYMAPLMNTPHSILYQCEDNVITSKLPRACVEKRYAYVRLEIHMWFTEKPTSNKLCEDEEKLVELEHNYNNTIEEAALPQHFTKLDILRCSQPSASSLRRIDAVITDVLKQNDTSEYTSDAYSTDVIVAYQHIVGIMKTLGYIDGQDSNATQLIFNTNESVSILGYHCDSHLQLRKDENENMCVGCGKGFWMDVVSRKCHPCGPGFYGPTETAVACFPCPVQYVNGLWSATDIRECFESQMETSTVSRILEAVLVPVMYLVVLIIVVSLLNKFSLVQVQPTSTTEGRRNTLKEKRRSPYSYKEGEQSTQKS